MRRVNRREELLRQGRCQPVKKPDQVTVHPLQGHRAPGPPGRILAASRARGAPSRAKAANLLDRLQDDDLSVLAFLVDPKVPFTNQLVIDQPFMPSMPPAGP